MQVGRRYLLEGRVQGVGFRYFTQAAAAREGVCGWVRNTADGHVEIAAEGAGDSMDRFERTIRQGPRSSRVDRVRVEAVEPTGSWHGFTIR